MLDNNFRKWNQGSWLFCIIGVRPRLNYNLLHLQMRSTLHRGIRDRFRNSVHHGGFPVSPGLVNFCFPFTILKNLCFGCCINCHGKHCGFYVTFLEFGTLPLAESRDDWKGLENSTDFRKLKFYITFKNLTKVLFGLENLHIIVQFKLSRTLL